MMSRKSLTYTCAVLAALGLSACNSAESPMGVTKKDLPAAQGTAAAPGAPAPAAQPGTTAPAGTAVASGAAQPGVSRTAKLRFAPIVGAPIAAATPLSQRLSALAKAKGIVLGTAADTDNTHIMKGYFSALPDGNQTTIIYVWDVLDPAGTRLHRIQGQEIVPGNGTDPWSTVPPKVMESIADKAIDGYLKWVSGAKT
ncbi:hypothetical protein DEV92_110113 [Phyllobacterium myrsinacearum]|uniref:Lipoprotein n=2 Tax=Phyllobacterium myrsinacearum TaxID=28101 RepID=A0A2S9JWR9_9HYPH|nr:hypothetical protein C5750_01160 [Phyllobacterium myrsinacearum]PWV88580.1 hypothetical protein DEV92_110113 [Phyllobacterium myrsinacearum]RZV10055.1 hypothetical protein EV654_1158 [Phyllobacterium myrsinacearum]